MAMSSEVEAPGLHEHDIRGGGAQLARTPTSAKTAIGPLCIYYNDESNAGRSTSRRGSRRLRRWATSKRLERRVSQDQRLEEDCGRHRPVGASEYRATKVRQLLVKSIHRNHAASLHMLLFEYL